MFRSNVGICSGCFAIGIEVVDCEADERKRIEKKSLSLALSKRREECECLFLEVDSLIILKHPLQGEFGGTCKAFLPHKCGACSTLVSRLFRTCVQRAPHKCGRNGEFSNRNKLASNCHLAFNF